MAVYRTSSGAISITQYGDLTTAPPSTVPGAFADPVAVQNSIGDVLLIAFDNFGGTWTNVFLSRTWSWQGWVFRGGILAGTPAVAIDPADKVHICARDIFGSLWYATYQTDPGIPSPWTSWQVLPGAFGAYLSDPSIAVTSDGILHIVVRDGFVPGNHGGFWFGRRSGGQTLWALAGAGLGRPSVVAGRDDAAYAVVRDGGGGIWMARETGGVSWYASNGVFIDDPISVRLVPPENNTISYICVAGKSTGGGNPIYHTRFAEGSGNGWDGNWTNTGSTMSNFAAASSKGRFYLAGRASANTLSWYREGGGWIPHPGGPLGPLSATPAASSGNRIYQLGKAWQLSNNGMGVQPRFAWEPTSAAGKPNRWAAGWLTFNNIFETPPPTSENPLTWFSSWTVSVRRTHLEAPGDGC